MTAADLLSRLEALGVELEPHGDRLRLHVARGQLDEETKAAVAALKPEMLALLAQRAAAARDTLRRVPREGALPASSFQERLWFAHRLDPGSTAFNMVALWTLPGEQDASRVAAAFREVVRRHEILRATFHDEGGAVAVRLLRAEDVPVEVRDLRELPEERQRSTLAAEEDEAAHTPFDLPRRPPVRFVVYRLSAGRVAVLVAAHHIALDAWSFGLLGREFARAMERDGAPLPNDGPQYVDFAGWERERLAAGETAQDLAWWKRQLAGIPPLSAFPADDPSPTGRPVGAVRPFRLGRELTERLGALAREEGVTIYMALVAACAAVLHGWTGQDDLVLGSPAGLRERSEFEAVIGPFVQVLVLRLDLSDDPTFAELLRRTRDVVLDAHAHRSVPFERVVEQLNPVRPRNRSPVFQVAVVQHNAPDEGAAAVTSGGAIHDLTWFVRQERGELVGSLEYRTDLYAAETIDRISAQLVRVLGSAVADRRQVLSAMSFLSDAEAELVLERFNATGAEIEPGTFAEWFERRAASCPDACAVTAQGKQLTYRELDERAGRVARALRGMGVGPGQVVGLCGGRSIELLPALIGVHRARGAYLPLDPVFPQERLAFMLADSGARVVLADGGLPPGVPVPEGVTVVDLKAMSAPAAGGVRPGPPATRGEPGDLAYLMYTSGSTGRPKGVRVRQGELSNFLASMRETPGMRRGDVVAAVTTLSFDIAALELYLPLTVGARVHLVPAEVAANGSALARELERSGATVLQATPATWRLLLETSWRGPPGFRALCGGEPLPRDLASAILERVSELWNLYGPTETTVWSALDRVAATGPVLIGRPISNTRIYVLNRGGHPVPPGVVGEIWIGGAGVAEGYHGLPELTAERFRPDPFTRRPGARAYRTGDLGRWRSDGRLEHLGRADHQVKVRGFRIELPEIEAVLGRHPAVRQAVVVVCDRGAGDVRLIAYVVPAGAPPAAAELRSHARRTLPDYMVPASFVVVPQLPLTPNGKVDRNALPAPVEPPVEVERIPPRDALEAEIARIWEALLGVPLPSVHARFFELGGHSLLAARLVARIEQATGVDLPLAALLEGTVAHLASLVRERQEARPERTGARDERRFPRLVALRRDGACSPLYCVHGAGGSTLNLYDLARHLSPDRPFYGFQARGLDGRTRPHETVEAMATEYLAELRAVQPAAPYYLSGYCGGGLVAWEMARRLQAEGERVAFLGLIDLYRPGLPLKEARLSRWGRMLAHEDLRTLSRAARAKLSRDWGTLSRGTRVALRRAFGITVPHELRDFWLTRSFFASAGRYELKPYGGRVTVFRARDADDSLSLLVDPGPDLGWARMAAEGVDARDVPGDHYSLMLEPNVRELARQIEDAIGRAEPAGTSRAG